MYKTITGKKAILHFLQLEVYADTVLLNEMKKKNP